MEKENMTSKLTWGELINQINEYYSKYMDEKLNRISISYLPKILSGEVQQGFFIIQNNLGEARFNLSLEDIKKILQIQMQENSIEILDLNFNENGIQYTFRNNPDIIKANLKAPDITYNSKMDYNAFGKIIVEYYRNTYQTELAAISGEYLRRLLSGEVSYGYFDVIGANKQVTITNPKVLEILKEYARTSKNEIKDIDVYDKNDFEIRYKKTSDYINEKGDFFRTKLPNVFTGQPADEPQPISNQTGVEQGINPTQPENVQYDEQGLNPRERRRFTIYRRETALNEAARFRSFSAVLAGLCIIGAGAAALHNSGMGLLDIQNIDVQQLIKQQIEIFSSWESTKQFIHDLGPLTTILSAGAGYFINRYIVRTRRFGQLIRENNDYNNAINGGNDDVKSR